MYFECEKDMNFMGSQVECGLNVCVPQNLYADAVIPDMTNLS